MHLPGEFLLGRLDLVLRDRIGDIHLVGPIAVELVAGRQHGHGRNGHAVVVVIFRVLLHLDMAVHPPALQQVGAARHIVLRLCPLVPVLLHGGPVHRIGPGHDHHVRKIGHRLGERELQRLFVQRFHTECFRPRLALHDGVGIEHLAIGQIPAVDPPRLRVGQAAETVDEIIGRDRIAIGPLGIAQMEGPDAVALAFPVRGQPRNGLALTVGGGQAIHQLADDRIGSHFTGLLRVERGGLDTVADDDAVVLGTLEGRRRLDFALAARQHQSGSDGQTQD